MNHEDEADDVIASPRHPYTVGLLASVPAEHVPGARLPQVPGSAPSLMNLPAGCAFAPRCFKAGAICHDTPPPLQTFENGRSALCHYPVHPVLGPVAPSTLDEKTVAA